MEDTVFSPKEWQTAEIPSSPNPNSIDQVEDREMGRIEQKAKTSYRQFYRQLTLPAVTISDLRRREAPLRASPELA